MKAREYKGGDALAQAIVGAWQENNASRIYRGSSNSAFCLLTGSVGVTVTLTQERSSPSRRLYGSYLFHCFSTTVQVVVSTSRTTGGACSSPRQRPRNPRQRLCRGLPSVKTPRGIFRRRRGLYQGSFIGHSANPLPRAKTALGKEKKPSGASAVGGFFAEGRPSAKK